DGDGDLDIVAVSSLYRNDGTGRFTLDANAIPPGNQSFPPREDQLVDVDGDGDLDIVAHRALLEVLRNDGTGHFTFVTAMAVPSNYSVYSFTLLDLERDGDVDIVAAPDYGNSLQAFVNDGSGVFTRVSLDTLPSPGIFASVKATRLDVDGDTDLVVSSVLSGSMVLYNDGLGNFSPVQLAGAPRLQDALVGDLDGDGIDELVESQGAWSLYGSQYYYLPFPPSYSFGFLHLADLDGDLDLDATIDADPPAVLINTGFGFSRATSGGWGRSVRALDLCGVSTGPSWARFTTIAGAGWAMTDSSQGVGIYQQVPLPSTGATDAALGNTNLSSFEYVNYVQCTPTGPRFFHMDAWIVPQLHEILNVPSIGTPTHVGAARLTAQGGIEFLFGDPTISGPVRVSFDATGTHSVTMPSLPPAAPHQAPARETVRVADIDGDGDDDVLHELRVLWNDGSGNLSVGPDFSALVSSGATDVLPFDLDGDGDLDLLCYGLGAQTTLLENDQGVFRDVTIGRIPPAEYLGAYRVTAGDVDDDGDLDLLVARSRSNLLRNDGGVFTRLVDVGPPGVLVDVDYDGRPDLFDGETFHINMFSQLHAPHLATPGGPFVLELRTCRQGPIANLALLVTSAGAVQQVVPGIGEVWIDPPTAVGYVLPLVNGSADLPLSIPRSPLLLGFAFTSQALVFDPQRLSLTNPVFATVR
ncbi:MAG: VCBS repeat-containing protein, partial [Planctomycetes bacterium]|nr:VCBS repeat-containing protein [Planctomycetota bacterium]